MLKSEGFKHASLLDLNMGYYNIKSSPGYKHISNTVLPRGNNEYQKRPMGVCNSLNIFKKNISRLFEGLDRVREYIDNVIVTTKHEFIDHMKSL